MRKLLWLLPAFFVAPVLASVASWWCWFFAGIKLIDPYTELHALTACAGALLTVPAIFIASVANE